MEARAGTTTLEKVALWQKRTFWLVALVGAFTVARAVIDTQTKSSIELRIESLEYGRSQQIKRNAAQDEVNESVLQFIRRYAK